MATDCLVNPKDMDLMQMLYQQDCDLGFEWNHLNAPVKQMKEIEDIKAEKNSAEEFVDFIVDGETGEHIPIIRTQNPAPLPQITTSPQDQYTKQHNTANVRDTSFDVDDYLDIFTNMPDEVPTMGSNQNANLWQQIDNLSQMNGMNLLAPQKQQQHITAPLVQNLINSNISLTNTIVPTTTVIEQHRMIEEQSNATYNHRTYNQFENRYESHSALEQQQSTYHMGGYSSPGYHPAMQTSPGYMSSPISSDDGVPMGEVAFSSMVGSSDVQEPNMMQNRFNDYQFNMDTGDSPSYGAKPPAASFPEPGQIFFEQSTTQNVNNAPTSIISMKPSIAPYASSTEGPFINPSRSPFHPPPLGSTSPPMGVLSRQRETLYSAAVDQHKAIAEYFGSDSETSLDRSPLGSFSESFNYQSQARDEDFNGRDFLLTNHDQISRLSDVNVLELNHKYDAGVGSISPQSRKKAEKLSRPRESRDERKARELDIPFTLDEIILSAVEDYNDMVARTPLTPAQQALVKDIRRRGKNKVAAQNCRKRKIETISNMEEDVDELREKKQQLEEEKSKLETAKEDLNARYNQLYQQIFNSVRDDTGRPHDPNLFRLKQVEGAVLFMPRAFHDDLGQVDLAMKQNETGEIDFSKVKIECAA